MSEITQYGIKTPLNVVTLDEDRERAEALLEMLGGANQDYALVKRVLTVSEWENV